MLFRGGVPRRRGRRVIPRRCSSEASRGGAAATTRTFRGGRPRRIFGAAAARLVARGPDAGGRGCVLELAPARLRRRAARHGPRRRAVGREARAVHREAVDLRDRLFGADRRGAAGCDVDIPRAAERARSFWRRSTPVLSKEGPTRVDARSDKRTMALSRWFTTVAGWMALPEAWDAAMAAQLSPAAKRWCDTSQAFGFLDGLSTCGRDRTRRETKSVFDHWCGVGLVLKDVAKPTV